MQVRSKELSEDDVEFCSSHLSTTSTSLVITHPMFSLRRRWLAFGTTARRRNLVIIGSILCLIVFLNTALFGIDQQNRPEDRRLLGLQKLPEVIDQKVLAEVLDEPAAAKHSPPDQLVAGVLVICANRAIAIKNHLEQLTRLRPSANAFPIVVSQDGKNIGVRDAIRPFLNETNRIYYMAKTERTEPKGVNKNTKNYYYIAQHYKWALDKMFKEMEYEYVIITEDDLDIADDFFSYFSALKHLLNDDPSTWCVSAWNDNGGRSLTDRSKSGTLWKTDFFPGLGWMLKASLWLELSDKFPAAFWDDWMRQGDVRKGRVCVRPEVSRTAHNMKVAGKGTSNGLYRSQLSAITLPDEPVDFSLVNTNELLQPEFERILERRLREARLISMEDLLEKKGFDKEHSYRVIFQNPRQWRKIAEKFSLMSDIRSGMIRTAYRGIVTWMVDDSRVFAHPEALDISKALKDWKPEEVYDPKWDLMAKYLDFQKTYCKPGRFTGNCDPKDPELIAYFEKRHLKRKLDSWGEMIVN